jgi:hypothetical protein
MIQNIIINPTVLRLLWTVVSEINAQEPLSDRELSQIVIQKVGNQLLLGAEAAKNLSAYVSAKLPLIRDIQDGALAA